MTPGRRQIGEHVAGGVPARSVLMRLVSTARRIQEAYDEALAPFDITLDQCRMLDALRHAGASGLASGAFHDALRDIGVSPSHEAGLENEGWIVRDHEGHRSITGPGRQLIADLEPTLEVVEDRLAETLGVEELAELGRIVEKIVD